MRRVLLITIVSLTSILLWGCGGQDEEKDLSRTIIVYMVGDNNLSGDALSDIREMEQSYDEEGVNMLVFADLKNETPYLLKIGKGSSATIRIFPELNAADPKELNKILTDCIQLYPAKEYGLVLWSHGTSWLPSKSKLKSFGEDTGEQMDIKDLSQALPVKFDFLIFDACLMGAVEVAYELKDKAGFIISPSSETISDGFPYDRIVPELLQTRINLQAVAEKYFEYYNSQSDEYQSATISLIKTAELSALASEMNKIVSESQVSPDFDRTKVQRLDAYEEQYVFDMLDFINKAFPEANKDSFVAQLNKVILYKANTQLLLGVYPINNYCGLNCYIFHPKRHDLNQFYCSLEWASESGICRLFKLT